MYATRDSLLYRLDELQLDVQGPSSEIVPFLLRVASGIRKGKGVQSILKGELQGSETLEDIANAQAELGSAYQMSLRRSGSEMTISFHYLPKQKYRLIGH